MTTEPLIVTTFEVGTHCPMRSERGGFVGYVEQVKSLYLFRLDEFREQSRKLVARKSDFTTRARARGWARREAARLTQEANQ